MGKSFFTSRWHHGILLGSQSGRGLAKKGEHFMKFRLFFLLGILLLSLSNTYGEEFKGAPFPSLISSLRFSAPLTFCDERVPIEVQDIGERLEKELLISLWDRPQVILWLKRSKRYLPYMEEMLKDAELPDDIKYIAIAESALRPHVSSKKGAKGFWQFMTDTGRRYGLTVNEYIDERRNLFASTQAAIGYFRDLHKKLGSWTLAAAAYNMGEQGVEAEILEQGTDYYYHLYLPIETQRFVFRILSVKLIFSNPERYGFYLSEDDYYPPLVFDRIHLNGAQDIPIRIIAQAAKTHFKVIKDLNPEIRGHYLTNGSHTILIPKGSAKGFSSRFEDLFKRWVETKKERVYIVKKGDNLSLIADRFNVPLAALIIWNKLDLKAHIYPGDQLIIYRQELQPAETEEEVPREGKEDL
jgi:membrane-bound lytic murein transglycosylase D